MHFPADIYNDDDSSSLIVFHHQNNIRSVVCFVFYGEFSVQCICIPTPVHFMYSDSLKLLKNEQERIQFS